jgi:nicotinamide mononucleotide (NMN) deamidase PncC
MSDLSALAHRALEMAGEKNLSIVTAESCTAGKLAALLSEAPGAAERLHGSFVTYTKANKTRPLGIPTSLLQGRGLSRCRGRDGAWGAGPIARRRSGWPFRRSRRPF